MIDATPASAHAREAPKTVATRAKAPPSARRPIAARVLSLSRWVHSWVGVFLSILVLNEAVTGFFLLHKDGLRFIGDRSVSVDAWWLPAHLKHRATSDRLKHASIVAAGGRLFVGFDERLFSVRAGTLEPFVADAGFGAIRAIAEHRGAVIVAHQAGLATCSVDRGRCAPVAFASDAAPRPARALATDGVTVIAALAGHGLVRSEDGRVFSSWSDDARSREEPRAITRWGARWMVATPRGVLSIDDAGEVQSAALGALSIDDVCVAGERLCATVAASAMVLCTLDGMQWETIRLPVNSNAELGPVRLSSLRPSLLVARTRQGAFAIEPERSLARALALPSVDTTVIAAGDALYALGRRSVHRSTEGAQWSLLAERTDEARTVKWREILDELHTGKFFGGPALLLYDLLAVAMILFVLTGVHLWLWPRIMRRAKKSKPAAKR